MKAAGEISILLPIGSFWKRLDDRPSRVDAAEGEGDSTCLKRGESTEMTGIVPEVASTFEDLSVVIGVSEEAIKTSCQPWWVFYGV